jgi:hypothetical protein
VKARLRVYRDVRSLGDGNSGSQAQIGECGRVDRDIVRCVGRLGRQPADWFSRPRYHDDDGCVMTNGNSFSVTDVRSFLPVGLAFVPCTSNNARNIPFHSEYRPVPARGRCARQGGSCLPSRGWPLSGMSLRRDNGGIRGWSRVRCT